MSELKAKHVVDVYDDYAEKPCEENSQVYLKSEADKVIADLEESHNMEVEQLLMEIVKLKTEKENLIKCCKEYEVRQRIDERIKFNAFERLRRQKYKRCLAMALLWLERSETSTDLENELVSRKRCSKWMELAEKYKPNSTAQQGKGNKMKK